MVDGVAAAGRFLEGHGETFRTGFRTGFGTERPFVFSDISTGIEPGSPVGTIELKIMLSERGSERVNSDLMMPRRQQGGGLDIPGGPETTYHPQALNTYQGMPLHQPARSYVKFHFRYRSLAVFSSMANHGLNDALNPPPISTLHSFTIGAPDNWTIRPAEDYTDDSESEGVESCDTDRDRPLQLNLQLDVPITPPSSHVSSSHVFSANPSREMQMRGKGMRSSNSKIAERLAAKQAEREKRITQGLPPSPTVVCDFLLSCSH